MKLEKQERKRCGQMKSAAVVHVYSSWESRKSEINLTAFAMRWTRDGGTKTESFPANVPTYPSLGTLREYVNIKINI